MHITEMDIKGTPPFTEMVELDFDERVNLFIGPNASGKSTLLSEIDVAFNGDRRPSSAYTWKGNNMSEIRPVVFKGGVFSRRDFKSMDPRPENTVLLTSKDWTYDTSIREPSVIYIGPVRTGLPELYNERIHRRI